MPYAAHFTVDVPDRAIIDTLPGLTLLEFGVDWCPHCQAAQGLLRGQLEKLPEITHLKIEDGPGRRLGRSYRVKRWPTLILLRDGLEVGRAVRPTEAELVDLLS